MQIFLSLAYYQYKKTQCNTGNLKLSYSELDKLKLASKNDTEVTLRLPSNISGNAKDKNNFPHKQLLLIERFEAFMKLL